MKVLVELAESVVEQFGCFSQDGLGVGWYTMLPWSCDSRLLKIATEPPRPKRGTKIIM